MASTGILIVSNIKQIGKSLCGIEKYVGNLYIHLNIPVEKCQPPPSWGHLISQLYTDSIQYCKVGMKMSILVGSLRSQGVQALHIKPVDMLFCDSHYPEVCEKLRRHFNIPSQPIYLQQDPEQTRDICDYQNLKEANKMYDTVVIGGTFDRIHIGHKLLLTQAVLRSCRRLVVGVTTNCMNKSKVLAELILPVEQRIEELCKFLKEIDASLQYEVVPIDDPFGPTKTDPNMDMIVVSAETKKGGYEVNKMRARKDLRQLDIFCIDVVETSNTASGPKENKISSSNARIDLLGTRLRQPEARPNLKDQPYIIGLTGGIASGKTVLCNRLLKKGAQVLDCDKIAHAIYEPGQMCYTKVIDLFGKEIVNPDGRINRKIVGEIVFNDAKQLEALNNIVWPELLAEVKRQICALHDKHKCDVVVIEAAILLKAGWDVECHEVWSTMVPPELAVQRIMQRNGLSMEDARKRIASQMENREIVARSHVVFSSEWSDEFTQEQMEKAWGILMKDIEKRKQPTADDKPSDASRL